MPTPSRLVRVFISSTFRDFIQERDELVKKVFPELRSRCRARFVELLEVDLRWGITEEQTKSGETLRICLEEIDRCRPSAPVFFVGLLGERYGWIPPNDYYPAAVLDDPKLAWVQEHIGGKSVTELEILHGVLNNKEMRDKSFFYFRNDDYQDRHWDAISSYHVGLVPPLTKENFTNAKSQTPEEDTLKQRDLKQRVRDVSLRWEPKNYETPQDLASLVLEDLWTAIDLVFPESSSPSAFERESLEHRVFMDNRARAYVEREGLFEKLDAFANTTDPDSVDKHPGDDALDATERKQLPSVRVVLGESGSGKSALLAAWLAKRETVFYHFTGASPASVSGSSILRRLLTTLRQHGVVPESESIPQTDEDMVQILPAWLEKLSALGGGILLFDAVNQLARSRDRELWWWPEVWPANIRVIFSTLPGDSLREMTRRGWTRESFQIHIPPLARDEKRKIMVGYLRLFSRAIDERLQEKILEAPQTENPLFLRTILDELRLRARHEDLGKHIDVMLTCQDPAALFVHVLKNLEQDFTPKEYPGLVHKTFGLMGVAMRGLSEGELLQLLSLGNTPSIDPLPRHYWSPLYLALEESLVSREGQLSFFHNYLRQAVEREYLDEDWERRQAHARLGEIAVAWNTDRFSQGLLDYGLQHGAEHLRKSGEYSCLADLALSRTFWERQRQSSGYTTWTKNLLRAAITSRSCLNDFGDEEWNRTVEIVAAAKDFLEEADSSGGELIYRWLSGNECDEHSLKNILNELDTWESSRRFYAFIILFWKLAICEGRSDVSLLIKIVTDAYQSVDVRYREWSNWIDDRLVAWLANSLQNRQAEINFLEVFSTAAQSASSFMLQFAGKIARGEPVLEIPLLRPEIPIKTALEISTAVTSLSDASRLADIDGDTEELLDLAEQALLYSETQLDRAVFNNTVQRMEELVEPEQDEEMLRLAAIRLVLDLAGAESAFKRALVVAGKKKRYYWRSKALEKIACVLARQGHLEQACAVAAETRDPCQNSLEMLLIQLGRTDEAFKVFTETFLVRSEKNPDINEQLGGFNEIAIEALPLGDPVVEAEITLKRIRETSGPFPSCKPEALADFAAKYGEILGSTSAEKLLREAWSAVAASDNFRVRTMMRIASTANRHNLLPLAEEIENEVLRLYEEPQELGGKAISLESMLTERGLAAERPAFKRKILKLVDSFIDEMNRKFPEDRGFRHESGDLLLGLAKQGEWERVLAALNAYIRQYSEIPNRFEEVLSRLSCKVDVGNDIMQRMVQLIERLPISLDRQRMLSHVALGRCDFRASIAAAFAIPDRYWRERELANLTGRLAASGRWREAIQFHPWSWIHDGFEKCQCFQAVARAALNDDHEQAIRFTLKALAINSNHLDHHSLSIQTTGYQNLLKEVSEKCSSFDMLKRLLHATQDTMLRETCIDGFLENAQALDRKDLQKILRWLPLKTSQINLWMKRAKECHKSD